MIVKSGSLAADDVSVRCKVRRSPTCDNLVFGEMIEMTCTMRNWRQPTSGFDGILSDGDGEDHVLNQGPELLLCPAHVETYGSSPSLTQIPAPGQPFSLLPQNKQNNQSYNNLLSGIEFANSKDKTVSRTGSDMRGRRARSGALEVFSKGSRLKNSRSSELGPLLQSYAIPISEVLVADINGSSNICITTVSTGFFELYFDTKNSYDILLVFLESSIPEDNVKNSSNEEISKRSVTTNSSSQSVDMDTFSAKEMYDAVDNESAIDRFRRKMHRYAMRVSLVMDSLPVPTCCGITDQDQTSAPENDYFMPNLDTIGLGEEHNVDSNIDNMLYEPSRTPAPHLNEEERQMDSTTQIQQGLKPRNVATTSASVSDTGSIVPKKRLKKVKKNQVWAGETESSLETINV